MKLSKTNVLKLGSRGISHIFVPLAVVVLVAIGGTGYMVATHAATCPAGEAPVYNTDPSTGHVCVSVKTACKYPAAPLSYQCPKPAPAPKPKPAPKPPSPAKLKTEAKTRSNDVQENVTAAVPQIISTDNPQPTVAPSSSFTTLAAVPTPKPEVNAVVVTYVKDPADGSRTRLGDVKVKIARDGGNESCDTHSSNTATTNAESGYDSHHVLVKGTAHFLDCTAGTYTVTAIGRSGYTIVSSTTKTLNLSGNDQSGTASFVLEKKASKAKPAAKPTVKKVTSQPSSK